MFSSNDKIWSKNIGGDFLEDIDVLDVDGLFLCDDEDLWWVFFVFLIFVSCSLWFLFYFYLDLILFFYLCFIWILCFYVFCKIVI